MADAREKRLAAQKLLVSGINPARQREVAKQKTKLESENSFGTVAQEWVDRQGGKWKPSHKEHIERRLRIELLPDLKDRPIHEINAPELLASTGSGATG